jgi:RNA polymerase sigma factor (sigma-70 family)
MVVAQRAPDSSAELLRAARDGDEQSWAQLVDRHTRLMWSVCRSFRLGTAAAEDVIQTVWLRLLERGDTIREPGAVTAWLLTTARRECLAAVRRERRTAGEDFLPELVDDRTPEQETLRTERDRLLWQACLRLPERDRRLLVLFARGLRYDEVAAALALPPGSVGPTRIRALRKLRAELAHAELHVLADAL